MISMQDGGCTDWKDFPTGLRVLVVDNDLEALFEIEARLRSLKYEVTVVSNEEDALVAISDQQLPFHVALVEALMGDGINRFRILEAAKNLPVIMMSGTQTMSIVMQGIALGAADFLQKPLTEEKLKNIWQHVARKALCQKSTNLLVDCSTNNPQNGNLSIQKVPNHFLNQDTEETSTLEKPGISEMESKDECSRSESVMHFNSETEDVISETGMKNNIDYAIVKHEMDEDDATMASGIDMDEEDKLEAEIGSYLRVPDRLNMDESLDSGEVHDIETNEAEVKCLTTMEEETTRADQKSCNSANSHIVEEKRVGSSEIHQSNRGGKQVPTKKKTKVDWTPELHRLFVQAVEQLGVNKAIPSRILELMGVKCLTRHNIASHLQKYRSHRKHVMCREEASRPKFTCDATSWMKCNRDGTAGLANNLIPIQPRPAIGIPYPSSQAHGTVAAALHVWGHPVANSCGQIWHPVPTSLPASQLPEVSNWQYPMVSVDAWGRPIGMPGIMVAQVPSSSEGQPLAESDPKETSSFAGATASNEPADMHPPKEIVDAAIKDALANPQRSLPLGLKSPSMDSVISELNKQGIRTVPPSCCSNSTTSHSHC